MITCEEFFAEFADYLENQVSPEVRQELELHLSQCRACHVLCDSSRKTVKIVTESEVLSNCRIVSPTQSSTVSWRSCESERS